MKFLLLNNVFFIDANNKDEALLRFKELSPLFSNVTLNDIKEMNENNNYITVYRIPQNTNKNAIYSKIKVSAWETIHDNKFAIIVSPNNNRFWVDANSGVIVGKNINDNLPDKKQINNAITKRLSQLSSAKEVPANVFWSHKFQK